MELRTSSILSWLIKVEPSLGLMGLTFDELVIQKVEISVDFGFGLSCRSNTGLWCCSNGVSSMLTGFSTLMGLELELLGRTRDCDVAATECLLCSELQYSDVRSNMELWCCSSEVSSMLTGFSTMMDLELELLGQTRDCDVAVAKCLLCSRVSVPWWAWNWNC